MKKIVCILMLLVLTVAAGCQASQKQEAPAASSSAKAEQSAKSAEPAAAPEATLKTLDGTQVQLSGLSKDKPLYLNFWASWCPPCVKEMPHIEKLYQKYGDKVNFAAVTVDEKTAEAEAFVQKSQLTLPVYTGNVRQLGKDYGLDAIPVSLLIIDGKIVAKTVGGMDEAALEKFLAPALK